MLRHVFIAGCKGIPANYGGFETFVDKLTAGTCADIQYHVACLSSCDGECDYNGVHCFNIKPLPIGPARAIFYDVTAIKRFVRFIEENNIQDPVVYVLACRLGPFAASLKKRMEKCRARFFVNPDGHEWLRSKWSAPVKKYWKYSEGRMVKSSDLLVCDSKQIERYIQQEYAPYTPSTTYISYGADVCQPPLAADAFTSWAAPLSIAAKQYYLMVGRFIPENNYQLVLQEYLRAATDKKLVIIADIKQNRFYKKLLQNTRFDKDPRVHFVGTVYQPDLLSAIRANAFAYIHGHSVGGTNPSLLEALAATEMNLLYDVPFNREVAEDAALYFSKQGGSLAGAVADCEAMSAEQIGMYSEKARERIRLYYSWDNIISQYNRLFLNA